MKNFILALAGLLMLAPLSHAISRAGNGTVKSSAQGYQIEVPTAFSQIQILGEEDARFNGIQFLPRSRLGAMSQFIDLREFRSEYAEFVALEAPALEQELLANGWRRIATQKPCIQAYLKESATAIFSIVTWGEGYGFVLVGHKSSQVLATIEAIALSTELEAGTCRWK